MKFNPGDPVWARLGNGEVPGVVVGLCDCTARPWAPGIPDIYHVDINAPQVYGFMEQHLRPRRDGDKREPVGDWADCPWQPGRVKESA